MVKSGPKRALARGVAFGAVAALLTLASGCTTSSSNASLTTGATAGPTLAFESIAGPPPGVFNRLVDNISTEAQTRNLAIASREGASSYRVRGYLAAQVIRGRTHISWVWDVYDDDRLRTLRITGAPGSRGGAGPPRSGERPRGAVGPRPAPPRSPHLAAFLGTRAPRPPPPPPARPPPPRPTPHPPRRPPPAPPPRPRPPPPLGRPPKRGLRQFR